MLDINYIIDNKNLVIKKLLIKKFNAEKLIEEISKLDIIRKKTIKQLENKRFEINKISKDIGDLFKANKKIEAEKLKYKSVEIKQGFGDLDARLKEIEKNINEKIIQIPNIPHKSVKKGEKGKDCCEIIKKNDRKITLEKNNSPHWDLVEKFNLVDFKLGNKIVILAQ